MKIILDKDFATINLYEEYKLVEILWKRKISSEEYRTTFEFAVNYLGENSNVENFLSDIRLQGIVGPADRNWFQEKMVPRAISYGLKKAAVVFSGGVFAKYYLNNIRTTTKSNGLDMKFFSSIDEAYAWIKTS